MDRYTLKYKLRDDWDNSRDFDKLHHIIDLCGYAYNHILALHRRHYRLFGKKNHEYNIDFEKSHGRKPNKAERRKTFLSSYDIQKHMAKLKQTKRYAWLKEIPSQSLQDISMRIERGYKLFFQSIKNNNRNRKSAPPKFRSPRKYRSFTLKQSGWKLIGKDGLRISKWNFRFRKSREITGVIKTATIKRDACGDLYVCFSRVGEKTSKERVRVMTGRIAGMDFGIKTFLTIAETETAAEAGEDNKQTSMSFKSIDAPPVFCNKLPVLRSKSRKFSRKAEARKKQKRERKDKDNNPLTPSKSYLRARYELAKYHRHISDARNDWHWKLARKLSLQYDIIYIEDLNIAKMLTDIENSEKLTRKEKRNAARKLLDLAPYSFFQKLEQECRKNGSLLIKRDRYYASTQTCSVCGFRLAGDNKLSLEDREWTCPECGTKHDRDMNAAKNILTGGARPGKGKAVRRDESEESCLAGRVVF